MSLLNDEQFKILERLKTQQSLSVDAITKWLRKPKTAVRRALLDMEKKGLIERDWAKNIRGRPTLRFKLGSESKRFFPSMEAEVLHELIKYLAENGQLSLLEKFFHDYWEKKYERVMKKVLKRKNRDFTSRLEALKEVLNEDGFYARSNISKKNDQVMLKECHCPIAAATAVTDIPCHLEAQLISRVLNMDCASVSPMNKQQQSCQFILSKPTRK